MFRWRKITVAKFQRLDAINTVEQDDIDKLAYSVCCIWDKTPEEVNEWSSKKFLRYADRVTKTFSGTPPRSWFEAKVETDARRITYGQFVEVMYFLQNGMIPNLHNIAASIMVSAEDHAVKAQNVLGMPITKILHPVGQFLESWEGLIRSYSGLFETEANIDGDGERVKKEDPHPFIDQYGWIFSATKLAEHERVKLDEVWGIGVIQALNGLAYLKSKSKYEEWLAKK